jgi:hypothetical protein
MDDCYSLLGLTTTTLYSESYTEWQSGRKFINGEIAKAVFRTPHLVDNILKGLITLVNHDLVRPVDLDTVLSHATTLLVCDPSPYHTRLSLKLCMQSLSNICVNTQGLSPTVKDGDPSGTSQAIQCTALLLYKLLDKESDRQEHSWLVYTLNSDFLVFLSTMVTAFRKLDSPSEAQTLEVEGLVGPLKYILGWIHSALQRGSYIVYREVKRSLAVLKLTDSGDLKISPALGPKMSEFIKEFDSNMSQFKFYVRMRATYGRVGRGGCKNIYVSDPFCSMASVV